ncbi:MAG TPA: hypothetical protein VK524_26965 [Polyangiaceae bacterium]|nr:hypothetical protein [Polyangiaceae bacterium]
MVTASEIASLLEQFAPIRIHLTPTDEDRSWVELEQPREIEMVAGRGIRVVCTGRLRYALAGITLPLSIRKVQVLLEPKIVELGPGEQRLDFVLQIENADLENIPGLVDRAIVGKVNDALTPEATHMRWGFSRTFDKDFDLPERLEPLHQLLLCAPAGEVAVTREGVRLRLHLNAGLTRSKPRPTDD